MKALTLFFPIAVIIVSLFSRTAAGLDEAESLALVVKVISGQEDSAIRSRLLRGILRGLEGRRMVQAPRGWDSLKEELANSEDPSVRELAGRLSHLFGDVAEIKRALAQLKDPATDPALRRRALHALMRQQNADASMMLEALLDDPEIVLDAIRGYAAVENAAGPAVLLGRYNTFDQTQRRAVVETLATRERYAQALVTAIDRAKVPRDDIPAHVARALKTLLGDRFTRVFGEIQDVSQDREKLLAKYKQLITPKALAAASASRGRVVYKRTCAACHLLYGEGGNIGPDLTGSNRANLDYILLNSVDPSYDVPSGYKMVSIVTIDGRVVNGVIAEEDATRVVLKTVEQPRVVIAKEDIERRSVSPKSMMPDGQLQAMKPREVVDLVKYLRTTEQVEIAQ